jgi:hypothetical protein
MKKFLGVLTLVLFCFVVKVQAESFFGINPGIGSTFNYQTPNCTAHEYECSICGKTLFEHREIRWNSSGMMLSVGSCERDDGKTLTIPWSIKVCQDCYDKYRPEIKVYQEKLEAWIKVTREHQRSERLINEEKRRVQKLKDVQQEVDRLQQRLKELGK